MLNVKNILAVADVIEAHTEPFPPGHRYELLNQLKQFTPGHYAMALHLLERDARPQTLPADQLRWVQAHLGVTPRQALMLTSNRVPVRVDNLPKTHPWHGSERLHWTDGSGLRHMAPSRQTARDVLHRLADGQQVTWYEPESVLSAEEAHLPTLVATQRALQNTRHPYREADIFDDRGHPVSIRGWAAAALMEENRCFRAEVWPDPDKRLEEYTPDQLHDMACAALQVDAQSLDCLIHDVPEGATSEDAAQAVQHLIDTGRADFWRTHYRDKEPDMQVERLPGMGR